MLAEVRHRLEQLDRAAEHAEQADLDQIWNNLLDTPEVRTALATVAQRDMVRPDSDLRARLRYLDTHCARCGGAWTDEDACPHCGYTLPF